MCQDYPKIDHSEIRNTCYGCQRLASKAPFARRDSRISIANVYTPIAKISEWIWRVIQTVYSYLEQFLWHKTRVNNARNVCTTGQNYVSTIMGDHPLFCQMIPNKGFRSQEGVSRSQSGSPAKAWAYELAKTTPKVHPKEGTFCSDRGSDSCYIGNQLLYLQLNDPK